MCRTVFFFPLCSVLMENGVGLKKACVYACSAEQEGIKADPTEMCELISFIKRNKLQKESFVIGQNQCEFIPVLQIKINHA